MSNHLRPRSARAGGPWRTTCAPWSVVTACSKRGEKCSRPRAGRRATGAAAPGEGEATRADRRAAGAGQSGRTHFFLSSGLARISTGALEWVAEVLPPNPRGRSGPGGFGQLFVARCPEEVVQVKRRVGADRARAAWSTPSTRRGGTLILFGQTVLADLERLEAMFEEVLAGGTSYRSSRR